MHKKSTKRRSPGSKADPGKAGAGGASAKQAGPTGPKRQRANRGHFSASEEAASLRALRGAKGLPREFYDRDPRVVARELLGKVLVRWGRRPVAGRIVETEAYLGVDDPAAHSAVGRTARNAVMFGPAGHAYVYFIYGMHYCMNVSCEGEGEAGAVLLRGMLPVAGLRQMARARGVDIDDERVLRKMAIGPGRMAQAMGITRPRDNAKDVVSGSDLQIVDDGYKVKKVKVTPRIGIRKAAELELRYVAEEENQRGGSKRLSMRRVPPT